ncbi:hypothetical protein HZS_1098 [Henneguya salminicola]|nr:hypothetical protein HZS_1098 [Henneguya salminicola]
MIRQRINFPLTIPKICSLATPYQLNFSSGAPTINYIDSTFMSVSEILYQLCVIHEEYSNVLILCVFALIWRKSEIMSRRVWEKVRKILNSYAKLPSGIHRRHLSIHLCFHTIDWMFFLLQPIYGAVFNVVGNQHYTEIMKQQE